MKTKDLRKLIAEQLRIIITEDQGPYFTQDPKDGYARPKLNRINHAKVQGYINYTLGGEEKRRDAKLKPGRKMSLNTFYGLIKQIHIKKGEKIDLNTSTLEKWFNGHDIELDRVPVLFNFDTKEIEIVELEEGITRQKTEQAKEKAAKEVETEPAAPLAEILGEFKMGSLDINVDDIINMFVTRFKDDEEIRKGFRTGRITPDDFAAALKNEFGIKENISKEIYEDLLRISHNM